jgi:hypothetical protein
VPGLAVVKVPLCPFANLSVSWLISPLKSSHFYNSSILLARFLVCSTNDEVTADAFGNL